jgi:RecA-family ATPase
MNVSRPIPSRHRDPVEPEIVPARFRAVAQFCAEYVPLSYAVEPIIRSNSVYTLTARTGAGKTALLIIIALAVASGRGDLIGMEVQQGRVVYLA